MNNQPENLTSTEHSSVDCVRARELRNTEATASAVDDRAGAYPS